MHYYCEACKPEKPNGHPFSTHPPKDRKDARILPVKCEICGKQADWLVMQAKR